MSALVAATGLAIPGRLSPCDLRVTKPALLAVIGPNGGGKTSLLRALAQADGTQGSVTIDGEALAEAAPARKARLIGYSPASQEIAWPIPLRDFVTLPGNDPDRVAQEIDAFELAGLAERAITDLSTGERRRAMLARVFASDARLLLLDEPLANLDLYWVLRTLDRLAERRSQGAALLVAVHDLSLVERFDRVLLVDHGQIVGDDTPLAMLVSAALERAFRVRMDGGRAAIRPTAGPRSSP